MTVGGALEAQAQQSFHVLVYSPLPCSLNPKKDVPALQSCLYTALGTVLVPFKLSYSEERRPEVPE